MTSEDYLRANMSSDELRNISTEELRATEEFRAMSTDALRPSKETLDDEADLADPSQKQQHCILGSRGQHNKEMHYHRKQRSESRNHRPNRPRAKTRSQTSNHFPTAKQHGRNGSREALNGETLEQTTAYPNGYHFPPRYPFREQPIMAIVDLWDFYNTGFGFFLVMYALNVVGWGGMLFLLYCNAAPTMCTPSCDDYNSARQRWIETSSQVLNALLCVMGFGLAPWRLRDLYYLLKIRLFDDHKSKRRFAAVHSNWFRLPGSETLPLALGPKNIEEMKGRYDEAIVPFPPDNIPEPPLTGVRAPPTRMYRVDLICWFMIANTGLQCCLASLLWAVARDNRPEWASGVFVVLACTANATGSILTAKEGRLVRSIEGVPLSKRDRKRLSRDQELGIPHYNNISDKPEPVDNKRGNDNWGWVQNWGWSSRHPSALEKGGIDFTR